MPLELCCQECRDAIHERSLTGAKNALELSMGLAREVQLHLESCSDCRQACTQSLALESKLVQLAQPLEVPDMRGLVMKRIRQGERVKLPVLAPVKPAGGGREMVLVMLVMTLATFIAVGGGASFGIDPWFRLSFSELGLHLPDLNLLAGLGTLTLSGLTLDFNLSFAGWETPLLFATALVCLLQTGRWRSQSRV